MSECLEICPKAIKHWAFGILEAQVGLTKPEVDTGFNVNNTDTACRHHVNSMAVVLWQYHGYGMATTWQYRGDINNSMTVRRTV